MERGEQQGPARLPGLVPARTALRLTVLPPRARQLRPRPCGESHMLFDFLSWRPNPLEMKQTLLKGGSHVRRARPPCGEVAEDRMAETAGPGRAVAGLPRAGDSRVLSHPFRIYGLGRHG